MLTNCLFECLTVSVGWVGFTSITNCARIKGLIKNVLLESREMGWPNCTGQSVIPAGVAKVATPFAHLWYKNPKVTTFLQNAQKQILLAIKWQFKRVTTYTDHSGGQQRVTKWAHPVPSSVRCPLPSAKLPFLKLNFCKRKITFRKKCAMSLQQVVHLHLLRKRKETEQFLPGLNFATKSCNYITIGNGS